MRISGPDRYKLSFDASAFTVECAKGKKNFSGTATGKKPKLYVVSVDEQPIYVGVTKQPMQNRLRFGWKAKGEHGYHGYAFRHKLRRANLDVWCHEDALDNSTLDIETVEAEVVFLIRLAGQWPLHQTEIHFHPSSEQHREIAAQVIRRYAQNLA